MKTYTVSPGDNLRKVSEKVYGSPDYASHLFLANYHTVSDPNQLVPLQILNIPTLTMEMAGEALKREIFNA